MGKVLKFQTKKEREEKKRREAIKRIMERANKLHW